MLTLPRIWGGDTCFSVLGMLTILLHLGNFQLALLGNFQLAFLRNFGVALTAHDARLIPRAGAFARTPTSSSARFRKNGGQAVAARPPDSRARQQLLRGCRGVHNV